MGALGRTCHYVISRASPAPKTHNRMYVPYSSQRMGTVHAGTNKSMPSTRGAGGTCRWVICQMYPGMKCSFALAISFRRINPFCRQKPRYRAILKGLFTSILFQCPPLPMATHGHMDSGKHNRLVMKQAELPARVHRLADFHASAKSPS